MDRRTAAAEALYDFKYPPPSDRATDRRRRIETLLDNCRREVDVVIRAFDGPPTEVSDDSRGEGIDRGL